MVVGEKQREIKERTTKVGLDVNSTSKVMLSFVDVLIVHGEHAEVEVDALILICTMTIGNLVIIRNKFDTFDDTHHPSPTA